MGLGNPGPRYAATRHNLGFRVVERFAAAHAIALGSHRFAGRFGRGRVGGREVALLLPETFVNRSGSAVADAVAALPVEEPGRDLLVVLDDLDLPFGRLRLRPAGGAGGHLGLQDVVAALGSPDFPRLRVGIGRPPPGWDPVAWVLAPLSPEEELQLDGILARAAEALDLALGEGLEAAMNRVNRPPPPA